MSIICLQITQKPASSFQVLKSSRPIEISQWVAGGRKLEDQPIATEGFKQKWWEWWELMQPSGRRQSSSLLDVSKIKDWRKMQKWGSGGWVLIMLSLLWWGKASTDNGADWSEAVRDVTKVLSCLRETPIETTSGEPRVSKKRKARDAESELETVPPSDGRRPARIHQ